MLRIVLVDSAVLCSGDSRYDGNSTVNLRALCSVLPVDRTIKLQLFSIATNDEFC